MSGLIESSLPVTWDEVFLSYLGQVPTLKHKCPAAAPCLEFYMKGIDHIFVSDHI